MQRVQCPGFSVLLPRGWYDITDDLDIENAPFTLAHERGVGAIQFTIALNVGGKKPNPSVESLRSMVIEFGKAHALGDPTSVVGEMGPPILAAGSFARDDDVVRAWQVSDGRNFAFVTYTCAADNLGKELSVCERIVRSIKFEK